MALEVRIKRCCVLNCSTQRTGKNDVSRIAMHKLPAAQTGTAEDSGNNRKSLRARWLFLAGREEKDISNENGYVCGNHFTPKAYHFLAGDNKKLRKLDPRAEPSLLLPTNKENTASKDLTNRPFSEVASTSKSSSGADGKEMNCELLPNEGHEIQPVQTAVNVPDRNGRDSTEPGSSNPKNSSKSSTKLEKKAACKKPETTPDSVGAPGVPRKTSAQPDSSTKKNGVLKKKLDDPEPSSFSRGDHSNDGSNHSISTDSMDAKSSTTQSGTTSKTCPSASGSKTLRQIKVNGSVESTKINGAAPMENSPAPRSKRRYPEESEDDVSSGVPRKRSHEEQKSQARMKICPRRSDLRNEAGAISYPDIVAGSNNKNAYLKSFTEALLNAALQQLKKAFENQNTQLTSVIQRLSRGADDIENKYEDVTCRMNACKRAGSTRSVGVQISNEHSPLPTLIAETPQPPSLTSSSSKAALVSITQPVASPVVKTAPRRGRPPNSVRLAGKPPAAKVTAISEPVIDLTEEQPTVSIVRAPQAIVRAALGSQADQNLSSTTSKFANSYTRAGPSAALKVTPTINVTKAESASATKPDLSPIKQVPRAIAVKSMPPTNQAAAAKLLPASATPQPVPVGSIFSGQPIARRLPVGQNGSPAPQNNSQSQSPNKINIVGKTFRLPPDVEMKPVTKTTASSSVKSFANDFLEQQLPHPQTQQPVSQTSQPILQTKQPVSQTKQPVPQTKQPVPQTKQPVPQTKQPIPQTTQQPIPQTTQQPIPQTTQQPIPQPQQPISQHTNPQPSQSIQQVVRAKARPSLVRVRHPAPLPETPTYSDIGELHTPPAPLVDVKAGDNGIVVTWDMRMQANLRYSPADKYQIFTYTEGDAPPSTDLWRNIGTINALQLPMAVTLCAYKPGFRYYFAVRGVDRLNRYGAFNEPKAVDLRESIVL